MFLLNHAQHSKQDSKEADHNSGFKLRPHPNELGRSEGEKESGECRLHFKSDLSYLGRETWLGKDYGEIKSIKRLEAGYES